MWNKIKQLIIDTYVRHLNERVSYYHYLYGFDMGKDHNNSHNNEADGFKHTYMSAELSMYLGEDIAEKIVLDHEDVPNNPPEEKEMDIHNDYVGLAIARELKIAWSYFERITEYENLMDTIAIKVVEAMEEGKVITSIKK